MPARSKPGSPSSASPCRPRRRRWRTTFPISVSREAGGGLRPDPAAGRQGRRIPASSAPACRWRRAAAARLCFVNLVAQVKAAAGDLDRVARVVRLGGFIAAPAGVHPACAGDERRLRPGGGGVRRGGAACPHHHRRARPCRAMRRSRSRGCSSSDDGAARPAPAIVRAQRPAGEACRAAGRSNLPDMPDSARTLPDPAPQRSRRSRAADGMPARRRQPLRQPRLPRGAGGKRQRHRAHRLAAAARRAARRRRAGCSACAPLLCEDATARANTSSTMAGPMPSSAPAAATTRSCRSARPSARCPGPRLLVRPGGGRAGRPRWRRGWCRPAGSSTCPPSTSPSARRRSGRRWARPAGCSASARSSTGTTRATRSFDDFLGALASRKRKADPARAARRRGVRLRAEDAARARDHAAALGGLPPLLPQHHRQEMGPQRLPRRRASGRCWARRWATAWC